MHYIWGIPTYSVFCIMDMYKLLALYRPRSVEIGYLQIYGAE